MPPKAFRIRRQSGDGETLHPPLLNLCRCCYREITPDQRVHYCNDTCRAAHHRLRGAA